MFHKNASRFATRLARPNAPLPEKRPLLQQHKRPISKQLPLISIPWGRRFPLGQSCQPVCQRFTKGLPRVCQGSAKGPASRIGGGGALLELLRAPLGSRARATPIPLHFAAV